MMKFFGIERANFFAVIVDATMPYYKPESNNVILILKVVDHSFSKAKYDELKERLKDRANEMYKLGESSFV